MIQKADPPPDVDARGLDGVTACRSAMRPGSPTQVMKELRQRGGTDWADTTLVLGGKTHIDWDTRNILDFVPLDPNTVEEKEPEIPVEEEPKEKTEKKPARKSQGQKDKEKKKRQKRNLQEKTEFEEEKE